MAAMSTEADFVFIPEDPVAKFWPDKMCKKLMQVEIVEHLHYFIFEQNFYKKNLY